MPFDLAGDPRFQGDPDTPDTGNPGASGPPIVDMGAYEFPGSATLRRIVGGSDAVDDSASLIWPKAEAVGLTAFQIEVDQPVTYVASSVVTTEEAAVPAVAAFTHVAGGVYRIELDAAIPVGEWTIITLTVAGPTGAESTFTLCLGHLPNDINGDGEVNLADATAFGVGFRADYGTPQRERIDLNGDGDTNLNDATLFGQLWHGKAGHQPWQGQGLPAKP